MNTIELKYGRGKTTLQLPKSVYPILIRPRNVAPTAGPLETVSLAISNPVGGFVIPPIGNNFKVSIAINDKTRPVPHKYLLPPLLDYLHGLGLKANQIEFIIATGTHQPMSVDEFPSILPENIYAKYKVSSHDCDSPDLISLGTTASGTDVLVNRTFYEANLKILVGNIEPHHFMGFSGGIKTASIGLTGRSTINHNHSFLTSPQAKTGEFDKNPCRQDVEEIGLMIGVQAALNAVLSPDKQIIYCLFGDPGEVMKRGIPLSREICQVPVTKKFPVVIASAGGYPKDINLYQAQKAITNAAAICEDGGWVFLLAECIEGAGSKLLMDFMDEIHSPKEAISKFTSSEFRIGPHKAFQLAKQAQRIHIGLVSTLEDGLCTKLFCTPFTLHQLETELSAIPNTDKIAIMPDAVATIPNLLAESSK